MSPKLSAYLQLSLLVLFMALFVSWIYPENQISKTHIARDIPVKVFPSVEIEAKSAYVYDVAEKKVLYEKEADLQWPLASITKLMSALTASRLIPDYVKVTITSDDLREEGDTGLLNDEDWNLRDLVDFSLIVSSNDGMRAIASVAGSQVLPASTTAEARFVQAMNDLSQEIGLTQTFFLNQSGLDVSSTLSGGYGSAKDMAVLVDYILKNDSHLVEATSLSRTTIYSDDAAHTATNTNKALEGIPNVIASKTGFTDLSGGNVVIAWNAGLNRPIIISVLGSSYDGRFEDLSTLVDATLEYLMPNTATSTKSI
jgi:D-alanyl-D-alanine carboxypeptidase